MSSTKFEMGSAKWIDHARTTIETMISSAPSGALDGAEFSVCEVYTDVPAHIASSGRASWYFRLRGTDLEFGLEEVDDVDFKAIVDYETVVPLGRLDFASDPTAAKQAQEGMQKAVAAGKMKLVGNRQKQPAVLAGLHDALAEITA